MQDEIACGALAFRPIGQPQLTCTRAIAFHRAASNTLVPAFADMACDAIATLAENGVWPDAQMIKPGTRTLRRADVGRAAWQSPMEVHEPIAG